MQIRTGLEVQVVSHVELSSEEASYLRRAFPDASNLKEAVLEAARLAVECSREMFAGDESPAGSH